MNNTNPTHAADRAALVAQLDTAETSAALELAKAHAAYKAQVSKLTLERDEARVQRDEAALARHEFQQKVAQLQSRDRTRDDFVSELQRNTAAAETEVARLKEALAAAERKLEIEHADAMQQRDWREAAESECAALRAEVERLRVSEAKAWDEARAAGGHANTARRARERQTAAYRAAESGLAAASALLGEISESNNTGRSWRGAIRALLTNHHQGAAEQLRERLAAANALRDAVRREYNAPPETTRLDRIGAVLSNQSAAPATRQPRDLGSLDIADGLDEPVPEGRAELTEHGWVRLDEPSAPTRTTQPNTGNKPPYSSSGHSLQYAHSSTYQIETFDNEPAAPKVKSMPEILVFKSTVNAELAQEKVGEYPTRFAHRVHDLLGQSAAPTRTEAEQRGYAKEKKS